MINLKFRGKCIKTGNWVYGGGIDSQRDTPIIINHGERYHVDAESVGQYIGMKNGDGIEIYQGDILVDDDSDIANRLLVVVSYDETQAKFIALDENGRNQGDMDEWDSCLIVGNTTDNKGMVS